MNSKVKPFTNTIEKVKNLEEENDDENETSSLKPFNNRQENKPKRTFILADKFLLDKLIYLRDNSNSSFRYKKNDFQKMEFSSEGKI